MAIPLHPVFGAKSVLDGVERWALGFLMLREIGLIPDGRLDAVMVPLSYDATVMQGKTNQSTKNYWERCGLVGIEVKVKRGDFLAGLRREQFQHYDQYLTGLYVATPPEVCKTSEIPKGIGHLIVGHRHGYGKVCICRRHPVFKQIELQQEMIWKVLFRCFREFQERENQLQQDYTEKMDRVGELASEHIFSALRNIRQTVEKKVGE